MSSPQANKAWLMVRQSSIEYKKVAHYKVIGDKDHMLFHTLR